MTRSKAKILVVEDDPAILRGLLDVLVFNGYLAEGAADGGEGLEQALAGSFDLAILDVMLPTMDGFTICRQIRMKKPGLAIIMLTAKGAEKDVVTGFAAGVDDYISKPFSLRELMVRVEAVLRRCGRPAGQQQFTVGNILFDGATLTASANNRSIELTRRELDIVAYLHLRLPRIVSKQELLQKVWNYAVIDIETRTVDIHILKLRKKIQSLVGDLPLIVTVRGEGYRLEPVESEP